VTGTRPCMNIYASRATSTTGRVCQRFFPLPRNPRRPKGQNVSIRGIGGGERGATVSKGSKGLLSRSCSTRYPGRHQKAKLWWFRCKPPAILIGLSNKPRLKNIYYPTASHPTRVIEYTCEANMPVEIRYGFYGAIIVPQYFDPASFRTCEVCLGRRVLRDSFNTSGQDAFMNITPWRLPPHGERAQQSPISR